MYNLKRYYAIPTVVTEFKKRNITYILCILSKKYSNITAIKLFMFVLIRVLLLLNLSLQYNFKVVNTQCVLEKCI